MSQLNWDKYRQNATIFAHEWAAETDEKGEAHSFWDAFFRIFDLERRHFGKHEARVKRAGNRQGFIDFFWKGKLLVEHKSASKSKEVDWQETFRQALEYVDGLPKNERPQRVVLCNFRHFRIYDLTQKVVEKYEEVAITELPAKIRAFQFLPDFVEKIRDEEEKANIEAALQIGNIHDVLHREGYQGHDLELLLVRILFCMFAEDTNIFSAKQFTHFIEKETLENGKDVGTALEELFETLNTPMRKRGDIGHALKQFPYVNGGLFAEKLSKTPPSTMGFRNSLVTGNMKDWAEISPEIFGSLFQAVLSDTERRSLGAHFTSEKNIRRLIDPLFMRDLWAEFYAARVDSKKLEKFRKKIAALRFLDPACGCGNFLVVTYRELRLLDLEIVRTQREISTKEGVFVQLVLDTSALANISLNSFHGLEVKPVSALIAQTALWLTEHQCNRLLEVAFGQTVATIPLDDSGQIRTGNALLTDWNSLLPAGEVFDFIIGNPPFSGSKIMDDAQRTEIKTLFDHESGSGTLDYVTGWYLKAAQFIDKSPTTLAAFVSTNSICQGEQVGMLWGSLFRFGMKIRFAHQTFKWLNEAPGVAAVYCIIVGFGKQKPPVCRLFEYPDIKNDPIEAAVKNINPYLVEAGDVLIRTRSKPICDVPEMMKGSQPTDGGNLLFTEIEKDDFLKLEPFASKFIRPFIGADEFINGWQRYCLWLENAKQIDIEKLPQVVKRVEAVRQMRLLSSKEATRKWAEKPMFFTENRQPTTDYIIIPSVSSERRNYVPIGFIQSEVVASNLALIVSNADLFLFGILTSEMHMSWMRYVCGRLKSDYRYSNTLVYNNFPFPIDAPEAEKKAVETAATTLLSIRKTHQDAGKTLAQLYDPEKMPSDLLAAHQILDRAVDASYGLKKGFSSEAKRVAWLFERYEALVKKEELNKKKQ
jgi:hypothetical protein